MALYTYPLGLSKPALGLSRYRDSNSGPTSPLTDNIATAPSGPVSQHSATSIFIKDGAYSQLCSGAVSPVSPSHSLLPVEVDVGQSIVVSASAVSAVSDNLGLISVVNSLPTPLVAGWYVC